MQQEWVVINQYFEDFLHECARDGFRPKEYLICGRGTLAEHIIIVGLYSPWRLYYRGAESTSAWRLSHSVHVNPRSGSSLVTAASSDLLDPPPPGTGLHDTDPYPWQG